MRPSARSGGGRNGRWNWNCNHPTPPIISASLARSPVPTIRPSGDSAGGTGCYPHNRRENRCIHCALWFTPTCLTGVPERRGETCCTTYRGAIIRPAKPPKIIAPTRLPTAPITITIAIVSRPNPMIPTPPPEPLLLLLLRRLAITYRYSSSNTIVPSVRSLPPLTCRNYPRSTSITLHRHSSGSFCPFTAIVARAAERAATLRRAGRAPIRQAPGLPQT